LELHELDRGESKIYKKPQYQSKKQD